MIVSAIIPTKGRPDDLGRAVASVLKQSRIPEELIIVDQTDDDRSSKIVHSLLAGRDVPKLVYVHDTTIQGLVCAKQAGVQMAQGEIICFLEDDIGLETDYLEQIVSGFGRRREMMGCGGVITNPLPRSAFQRVFHALFHLGLFYDPRPGLFRRNASKATQDMVPSKMISGGVSAWRAEVFRQVSFDTQTGFHMYEDIDFSMRVAAAYPGSLFLNPRARLEHYWSPINRDAIGPGQQRKVVECFAFYRKHGDGVRAALAFRWLLIGFLLDAAAKAVRIGSFAPLRGFWSGLGEGGR